MSKLFLSGLFEGELLEDARKEKVLALVFPRQMEKCLSNLKILLSILPWMVEAIPVYVFTFLTHGRPTIRIFFLSSKASV